MPKLQTATLRPDLTRSDLEHLKFLEHSQKSAYRRANNEIERAHELQDEIERYYTYH